MERIPVYILAGGRSSRFGADKARAIVKGVPMLARVAQELSDIASCITAVADIPGKYDDLGIRTIADRYPGLGPLAGLHASLLDAQAAPWLLLVSCDLVAVRRDWVQVLMESRQSDSKAVAFRHDRWEPLLALYATAATSEVTRRIAAGKLAMQQLLTGLPARAVTLPADWPVLCQVNTPAELAEYVRTKS